MTATSRILGLLALVPALALAQPAQVFEVADVHVSPANASQDGGFLPSGRIEFRATTLLRLIAVAYSVPIDRIAGGPSWLDVDRFDVVAKAPSGASQIALRNMLQNLIAERFHLAVKNEDKPVPVFVLRLVKKGVAKASSGSGDPDCKNAMEENVRSYTCHNVTMASLGERLQSSAPGYFNLPIIDKTGLEGAFDFQLRWVARGQLPPGAEGNDLSLFTSIEKQLGVKAGKETSPMPVLNIQNVDRTPTPNQPGVEEKLGPRPTEFEVVNIHPSRPDEKEDFQMTNGRIAAKALLLTDMISFAYNMENDWVRGGQKWLETDRYDITAKTEPTASTDTLRTMLQSLLAERFALRLHTESQPVTVYALTVNKSKLKDADPSGRSTCKQVAVDGARTYTCTNTTMTQLAARLRDTAGNYLVHPVVDLTGLTGAYDFMLSWSPRNPLRTGGNPESADRPAGLTIFEAVDRQLGLKLSTQKHPMPVAVIDHMNRTPTEN